MQITTYSDPAAFLRAAQAYLERNETATAIILGNVTRLVQKDAVLPPYLAVVDSPAGIELVAMMTPPHRLVPWCEQTPGDEALHLLAHDLHANGWSIPGVLGPPSVAEPWLEHWHGLTGRGWRFGLHERLYELTQVIAPPTIPGHLRLATQADLDLVARWTWEFQLEAIGPGNEDEARQIAERRIADQTLYVWDDGQPVTMAGHGRDTPRSSTISLVYTPPAFRRRGYAMACVAALSQRRLDAGKTFCTLFTDLANPTSNSIYQKIGYRPVCDFNEYNLDTTEEQ